MTLIHSDYSQCCNVRCVSLKHIILGQYDLVFHLLKLRNFVELLWNIMRNATCTRSIIKLV